MTTIRLGAPVGSGTAATIRLGAPRGAGAQPVTIQLGAPYGGGGVDVIDSSPFLVADPRNPGGPPVPARLFVWLPDPEPEPSSGLFPGEDTFPGDDTYPGGEIS